MTKEQKELTDEYAKKMMKSLERDTREFTININIDPRGIRVNHEQDRYIIIQ